MTPSYARRAPTRSSATRASCRRLSPEQVCAGLEPAELDVLARAPLLAGELEPDDLHGFAGTPELGGRAVVDVPERTADGHRRRVVRMRHRAHHTRPEAREAQLQHRGPRLLAQAAPAR